MSIRSKRLSGSSIRLSRIFPVLLVLGIVLGSFGCAKPLPVVLFHVPDELRPQAESLLEDFPYPEAVRFSIDLEEKVTKTADLYLSFESFSGNMIPAGGEPGNLNSRILLQEKWFAPVAHFLEGHLPDEKIGARILPLDEIRLPLRALKAWDLYPGEEGYAFVERLYLSLKLDPVEEDPFPLLESCVEGFEQEFEIPDIRTITAVGDILASRGVDQLLYKEGGVQKVFGDTYDILNGADLALGNLEGAVSRRGEKEPKSFNFRFSPRVLPPLKDAGFDYFCLTNNHAFDYGLTAFRDTLVHLDENQLGYSGAGLTPEEASAPWQTELGTQKVNILSLGAYPRERNGFDSAVKTAVSENTPGVLWQGEWALDKIEEAFKNPGFNIVMVHGGYEWTSTPSEKQKELYRELIDRGADLVAGHHPHVLQGIEHYKDGLIHYSLGNFIFPGMAGMLHAEESMILRVGIYKERILYLDLVPVQMNQQLVSVEREGKILGRFLPLSKALNPENRD